MDVVVVGGAVVVHQHVTRRGAHLPRVLVVAEHHSKAVVYVQHTSGDLSGLESATAAKTPVVVDEVVEVIAGDASHVDVVNVDIV